MPAKVAVVIPVYKAELNELEKISLAQCRKVLGNYQLIFVAPAGKKISYFAPTDGIAYFPPQFFQNVKTYNQLMKSPAFYSVFKDFEYILIYQLDAFVFYDALEEFCALGYDYIGAPWPKLLPSYRNYKQLVSRVGNGGFSLRKVKAHYNLLFNHSDLVKKFLTNDVPEDVLLSICGKIADCNFHVAPINVAYKFSAEIYPTRVIQKNGGNLPFGCHAWFRYGADLYTQIFLKFGYDLRLFANEMTNCDCDWMQEMLKYLAFERLTKRFKYGRPILRYLPKRNFQSVRIIRRPLTNLILAQLLIEDNSLSDKCFFYEPDQEDMLLNDLTSEQYPHLLIHFKNKEYDKDLIAAVEKRGFVYGKHFVTFWREYIARCQELFHNLGK